MAQEKHLKSNKFLYNGAVCKKPPNRNAIIFIDILSTNKNEIVQKAILQFAKILKD